MTKTFSFSRGRMRSAGFALALMAMAGNVHAQGILRITEVMSSGDFQDWFEISNYGTTEVDITGDRVDDASFDFTRSLPLNGVTTVAPGESVVFIESAGGVDIPTFRTNWGLAPSVQVGYYSGSGIGFSSNGDGATVYDSAGTELPGPTTYAPPTIRVTFGAATTGSSFYWYYDSNGAAANTQAAAATQLSAPGQTGYVTWDNLGVTMKGTPGATMVQATNYLSWIGGGGTWNATGGTDWTPPGEAAGGWDQTKTAIFGSTAGTVTLGNDIVAEAVQFDTAGYSLAGAGNTLELTTGVASANALATIAAEITGSAGLTKGGSGVLILDAANSYSGITSVSGGELRLGTNGSLPTGSGVSVGANSTFNANGKSVAAGGLQGLGTVTMGAGSMTVDIPDATEWEFNGAMTGSGDFIVNSTGTGVQRFDTRTITTGALKAYTGATIVREGTLEIGIDGSPSATSEVNVETGGVLALTSSVTSGTYSIAGGAAPINLQGGDLRNGAGDTSGETTSVANTVDVQQASSITLVPGLGDGSGGTIVLGGGMTGSAALAVNGTGTLRAAGGLGYSGAVTVASTAVFGGTFEAGSVGGAGLVSPGNSPGVATTGQVDPAGGTGFAFEFTAAGAPDYASPDASINDVLNVTDTTTPFVADLTSSNLINAYLDVASLGIDEDPVFEGGFFSVLGAAALLDAVDGATLNVFVRGDSAGSTVFNGVNYYSLADWNTKVGGTYVATLGALDTSADFGAGAISGSVTTVSVVGVPEPSTVALASLGGLFAAAYALRRRKTVS